MHGADHLGTRWPLPILAPALRRRPKPRPARPSRRPFPQATAALCSKALLPNAFFPVALAPAGLFTAALLAIAPSAGAARQPTAAFTDITEEAGLRFVHDAGSERYSLPEITGAGAGFFDADGDGDLDLYLLQGGRSPDPIGAPPDDPDAPGNALYLQGPDGRFTDASESSGLAHRGYGMGLAAGDYDGDGLTDLFVTNYGPDALFRNRGGGRFEEVTAAAGVAGEGWSASAVFCDYDADGRLDLFVTRYVRNDPTRNCTREDGARNYCSPQVFRGIHDYLYHNRGDGSFAEVSLRAGLRAVHAAGLGVVCSDFDGDRRLDFYVANDGAANHLWLNRGGGEFADDAFLAGVALNDHGRPEAGMGIALGDVDGDLDFDLFVTHVVDETNTLYRSDGGAFGPAFADRTGPSGLGSASMKFTGFGVGFLDLDFDGALDLVVANGRVGRDQAPFPGARGNEFFRPFAEPNQVFRNTGTGGGDARFEPAPAGDLGEAVHISRGLAFGDFDEDGDRDLLVANDNGPARLYRNDYPRKGTPLRVRPLDAEGHPAFPVRVRATLDDGRRLLRRADRGGSYLAANDPRAFFGLPPGVSVVEFLVRWPDGAEEVFPGRPGPEVTLRRGAGSPP